MKVSVRFFKGIIFEGKQEKELIKTESFQTKKLAKEAIKKYLTSVTIHEKVKQGLSAYIETLEHPYCL